MESMAPNPVAPGRVPAGRLLRVGALAAVGLFLSFLPIALAGATGSSAGTLALMHVVAAVTNVGLLMRLGRKT